MKRDARRLSRKGWIPGLLVQLVALIATCSAALAAGGGKPVTKLVNVADTRAMSPGFSRWVADIYNGSFVLYAILVVASMVMMGLILGFLSDRVIARLGINLGRLDHRE